MIKKNKNHICSCVLLFLILFIATGIFRPMKVMGAGNDAEHARIELTAEEQDFVAGSKEIVIGCPTDTCPLLFMDKKTEEMRGITIDILNILSDKTGLTFRYVPLASGSITYQDLQNLQVDLVASVECHDVNAHAHGIVMTKPYLQTAKVFVCKKGVVLNAEQNMVIAVASGSPTLAKVINLIYPNFQVDYYTSTEEALAALLQGKADAVLQNQYSLQRILAKPIYDDLQIVDAAAIGDAHCLAALVQIDEDGQSIIDDDVQILLSILDKAIESLDPDEISFIIIKESAENVYQFTLNDFVYRYRYAIVIILIAFVLILFLLWQVYILRKKREQQLITEKRAKELSVINEHMHEQQILLKDALAHAEAGNRAKTSFLFNMSHDIRTPMNAILGMTALALKHKDEPDKLVASIHKIDEAGKELMQLLNNVLDMSRIENGKADLSESACDLPTIITQVRDAMQIEIEEKKLTVQIDTTQVRDRKVYCDEIHMNEIMFNLFSNAVKFSKPEGNITVVLRQSDSDIEDSYAYELRVKDDGIGMTQEFQQHIFEPFEKENTSTISRVHGMGLGMSITKSLVDLMGGTIKVVSEPDKGTEFILCFIFKVQKDEDNEPKKEEADSKTAKEEIQEKEPEEEASEREGPVDFTGRRVLVVEDIEINAEIIREILSDVGFDIEVVENGQAAVEKVQSSEPGYYDMVLMDIQMPIMNGYQATRAIRQLEEKALAAIPIIAMTANALEEDKQEALASGMNAHLSKPIDIEQLMETLSRF